MFAETISLSNEKKQKKGGLSIPHESRPFYGSGNLPKVESIDLERHYIGKCLRVLEKRLYQRSPVVPTDSRPTEETYVPYRRNKSSKARNGQSSN